MVKQLKDDYQEEEPLDDDEEEDDEDWDDDKEEETPSPKPSRPVGRPPKQESAPYKEPKRNRGFTAFHVSERIGIMDNETQKPVVEDQWAALAEIMTRLQRIEDALK